MWRFLTAFFSSHVCRVSPKYPPLPLHPAPHSNVPRYLNYFYGTLSGWAGDLTSPPFPATGFGASPCSVRLAQGMFGMGSRPSPALWLRDAASSGSRSSRSSRSSAAAGVAAMGAAAEATVEASAGVAVEGAVAYSGLGNGATDPVNCGVAVAAPGALKLAGWPLSQPVFFPEQG